MRCMLLALLLSLTALPAAPGGRIKALVIGINRYESRAISQLDAAMPDAKALREFLVSPGGPKCSPADIVLMTDTAGAALRPTRANVVAQLRKIAGLLQPEDTFIFYFAGHGVNRRGEDYLLPIDTNLVNEEKLIATAVPVGFVTNTLLTAPARQVLFVVDACRDTASSKGGVFGSALRIASTSGGDQADRVRATLSAARPGQRAFEWPKVGHGVFTWYLLEGLKGAAAEDNGTVTVDSLARYVQRQVSDWTKTYLKGRQSQLPWLLKDGVAPLELLHYQPKNLVSAKLDGTPLKAALQELARQVNCDLLLAPGVPETAPVTLTLRERPLTDALGLLLRPAGLVFEVQDRIIVVSQPTPAPATAQPASGPVGRDGMPLVLVPGGSYRRGSDQQVIEADLKLAADGREIPEYVFWNELTDREVSVDSFYLDQHEVTNGQYRKFVEAGGYRTQEWWSDEGWAWLQEAKVTAPAAWDEPARRTDELPVAGVSWFEADAYARWSGRRLPTEAEWEYAGQGGTGSRYDLGETLDPFRMSVGVAQPAAVKSHAASPFGLYDLTGNVAEWCADVYDPDFYRWGERFNPICVATLKVDVEVPRRCLRGGGYDADAITARVRKRAALEPGERRLNTGFRCAADLRVVRDMNR
ncbi:MAG: SUMF1/EgtB/PvdO family nonheme iron enzyme [Armatimonadetes bacterium]|nr:SUMF1/EgtB/PvdO family nonheme iron enzyme [Armatimonadota bacterium]